MQILQICVCPRVNIAEPCTLGIRSSSAASGRIWSIDITDDGAVSICGTDAKSMEEAQKLIHIIVTDYEAGQVLEGHVISIKEFGAFIEFAPGKEGMVHISKISKERVNHVEDVLTLGDKVKVVCLGKDKMGRFSFSMKDVAE